MGKADLGFTHRYVPTPSPMGERQPTLLLLHGTDGDEDDLQSVLLIHAGPCKI